MNLDRLVILQNQFMKVLFGSQPEFLSLSLILQLVLAMIFLTLSLAFLASYGAKKDKYQVGLVAAIISSIGLIAAIPTMLSLFIAAAVLVVLPILVLVYVWWVSESYPLVMRLAFIIALAVFYWASLRSSIRKRKEKRM